MAVLGTSDPHSPGRFDRYFRDPAAVDPTRPPVDARSVSDFLRQRGVQEPPAFAQVVERSL
jgi:hypothetical protein